jgi:NADH:ubiquinone oxidoreductase subunit H
MLLRQKTPHHLILIYILKDSCYIHIRKGPNEFAFTGLFQPFNDAIMFLDREKYFPLVSNYLSCYFSPVFSLFLSLLV